MKPRVLLQTTIPYVEDDWHVGRFSFLREELAKHADVVARNRENGADGNDAVLAALDESDFLLDDTKRYVGNLVSWFGPRA